MPKVFLTPLLIAGLLLLPSCSSGENVENVENSACDDIRERFKELAAEAKTVVDYDKKKLANLTGIYYGLGNEECFDAETIAILKAALVTWQK
jgi:hypothetical protein